MKAQQHFAVLVDGKRKGQPWGRFATAAEAVAETGKLLRIGMNARVVCVNVERSAENWFLDAATYQHDGETEQAVEAARSGIAATKR